MKDIFLQIWRFRAFIVSSVISEFKGKFVRSRLGGVWVIINPLAQVAVYALVLSSVLSSKLPGIDNKYAYSIYLIAGTMGWNLFLEIISRCINIFVDNANIMKKLVFPKITLPIIVTGSALINSLLLFLASVLIFGMLGHGLGIQMLWLPVLYASVIIFAAGTGLALGILNVFVRDINQIMPIVLQFWFWFTPIVYMKSLIPQKFLPFMQLNPMFHVVVGFQNVIVYNQAPSFKGLAFVFAVGGFFMLFAMLLYRKAVPEMVDVL
jgi:lipopolysaccharide transport system permease protein